MIVRGVMGVSSRSAQRVTSSSHAPGTFGNEAEVGRVLFQVILRKLWFGCIEITAEVIGTDFN